MYYQSAIAGGNEKCVSLRSCRRYGALTGDLVDVLLQADPAARPTAAQVLTIPAVRPYAEAYVRRMRAISERCQSPVTPLSPPPTAAQQRDIQTGNDVRPGQEVSGDPAACASKPKNDEKRSFYRFKLFLSLNLYFKHRLILVRTVSFCIYKM